MKHIIYKTTHINGKYYIGKHSTENLDDGYIGSGKWPRSIKDKSTLTREILEYAKDEKHLEELENKYLAEHYGKAGCMNMSNKSSGWATGDANPMKNLKSRLKISGNNNWTHKDPEASNKLRVVQQKIVEAGTHPFQGDKNPNKDGRNAKLAMERGTHHNLTNNPSTYKAEQGIHHWQNGNAPNYQGKQNKRLVEEGTHNFLGPEQNQKRVQDGTHNFLGPEANLKRLAEGTHPSQRKATCPHCGKAASISMIARWHNNNCRKKIRTANNMKK